MADVIILCAVNPIRSRAHTLVIDSVSRQQQLQWCREFQITLTPPWLVLSPGEKGGRLGVRLATSPHKHLLATETCTRMNHVTVYLSPWERRTSTKKMDDALQWKLDDSGSYKAKHPSRKKSYQDGNLEHKNYMYVWNRKDFPSCSRDEGLQPSTA